MKKNEVVIVAAFRTAIGKFGGSLKDLSAVDLARQLVVKGLERDHIDPEQIDEVIFGNVYSAGLGQNMARQIAIQSGIPQRVPATTINQVCGSGMKALMLGYQSILAGLNEVVLVGGSESMSNVPYLAKDHRWGSKLGDRTLVDGLLADGLMDAFESYHMGMTAENIAERYHISRQDQDLYAVDSHHKAATAQAEGQFADEIIPIRLDTGKSETLVFDQDESIRHNQTLEQISRLKPVFKQDGTVTAANASPLNDGAAALVLMKRERAEALNLPILAQIAASAQVGVDPAIMGTGPIPASRLAVERAGLALADIDLIEANEAFACQALYVQNELGLDPSKVNVNGGAIALGHPIGCSGARIIVTLVHEMKRRQAQYGLATLCIGGGQGDAVVFQA